MTFNYLADKIFQDKNWNNLNSKQKEFCLSILNGDNVFLTGAAGVGKSFVLNYLFDFLQKNGIRIGKTALSGIAALNIGGSTIHSWSGIGLGNTDMNDIFKMVFRNKKARNRILSAQILFIDEISLCSGKLLKVLDAVYKAVRRSRLPFGGIQMIISGDIMQLPPVFKDLEDKEDFFFLSTPYKNANFKVVELTSIVRQKDDEKFASILSEIRIGVLSNINEIRKRIGAKINTPCGVLPVKLLGYNSSVENYNKKVLDSINSKLKKFYSQDIGDEKHKKYFNKHCLAPEVLELKASAQVMLVYNIDIEEGLVNGLTGKVINFTDKNLPIVEFSNGKRVIITPQKWEIKEQVVNSNREIVYKVIASRSQIPLKLSWAMSIHKSQGSTLDYAVINLQEAFETGMAYVALSRLKNLEGLSISKDFDESKIKINKKCLEFYNSYK